MIQSNKDALGERMRRNYEFPYRFFLTKRTPVIIRIDMNNSHSFTYSMKKPFDPIFIESMHNTGIALCEQLTNIEFAYVQADEINLLLLDSKKNSLGQWLDGNLQKMVSTAASIATIEFNRAYTHAILSHNELDNEITEQYSSKINKMIFDACAFNIPESEIVNYFIHRQTECSKNSVSIIGKYYFSVDKLQNLNTLNIQEKLKSIGINWNELPTFFKRGICTKRESYVVKDEYKNEDIQRFRWVVDYEIPVFAREKEYINQYLRYNND